MLTISRMNACAQAINAIKDYVWFGKSFADSFSSKRQYIREYPALSEKLWAEYWLANDILKNVKTKEDVNNLFSEWRTSFVKKENSLSAFIKKELCNDMTSHDVAMYIKSEVESF